MTSAAAEGQGTPCYSIKWKYGVHICFTGREIEDGLIGYFKHAFRKRGIKTTVDDLEHTRGEEISQTAVKAIQQSRSSIVVFCPKFPFNRRCLDELATIHDCEHRYGQLVQPFFFQIEPGVVRHWQGCYGKALAEHLGKFKNEMKVKRWEVALHDVASLSGWPSTCSRSESQLIQGIVESISKQIHIPSCNADCLAGQLRITKPQTLFGLGSSDDVVTVENGSGGTGARNLPKAAGLKPFLTSFHRKEPENREIFIEDQPSTSRGYTLKFKDVVNPLGPEGTNIMQYKSPLNLLHSEGDATKKRKWISNGVEFNVEANAPRKQILTHKIYFQLLDSRGIEDGLISGKLKGGVEAFSAPVGVVNSTLLAVEGAGTMVTRTSEEVKSFMQTVTSKRFPELIAEGSEFKEHMEKIVLSFSADENISPAVRVALDNLKRKFTCWSEDYGRANTVLETTAADLSKADKLQADFDAAVNDCVKAVSAGREVRIQLDHKLREKRELEEELEAVESEIADLRSSLQEVAQRKSELLDKGTKLKGEKDELTDQVPGILGKQAEARVTQELIEAYWLGLVEEFNQIFKSEFGCS